MVNLSLKVMYIILKAMVQSPQPQTSLEQTSRSMWLRMVMFPVALLMTNNCAAPAPSSYLTGLGPASAWATNEPERQKIATNDSNIFRKTEHNPPFFKLSIHALNGLHYKESGSRSVFMFCNQSKGKESVAPLITWLDEFMMTAYNWNGISIWILSENYLVFPYKINSEC